MTSIVGSSNLSVLQTATETLWQDALNGYSGPYLQDLLALEIPTDGKFVNDTAVIGSPDLEEWTSAKKFYSPRALGKTYTIKKYHKSMKVDRLDLDSRGGAETVGRNIKQFMGNPKRNLQKQMVTMLLANTETGLDGVSLANDSHPFTTTTDNLTTSALTHSVADGIIQAMMGFKDEDGNLLDIYPTDFVCGPALQVTAFDVFAVTRPLAVSNAGAYGGTSNIVGATTVPNAFEGKCRVHICPEITGTQYGFFDLSKPGLRPLVRFVKREMEAITQMNMDDEGRFLHDEFRLSVEGDWVWGVGCWQTSYLKVAA